MSLEAITEGAKVVKDLGVGIYGAIQAKKAKGELDKLDSMGIPKFDTAQEYYDLYKNAQRDKAMEAEIANSQETMAANLAALERGGSRALIGGGASAVESQRESAANAAQRGFQRENMALSQLAAAQQNTLNSNTQADLNQRTLKEQRLGSAYQAGMEMAFGGAEAATADAISLADTLKKEGGTVKLKGEFSHKTNPKYIYDKEGNVEHELTGDETLVFNPKQRQFFKKVLKSLMTKGSAKANKEEANKVFKAFK